MRYILVQEAYKELATNNLKVIQKKRFFYKVNIPELCHWKLKYKKHGWVVGETRSGGRHNISHEF